MAGRKTAPAEFVSRLAKWAGSQAELARACRMAQPNVSNYASGKKRPTDKTLRSMTRKFFTRDRKKKEVEFLQLLVHWAGSRGEFCRRTGVLQPNLASYLGGSKNFTRDRLYEWTSRLFAPVFHPLAEIRPLDDGVTDLDGLIGVYALFDSSRRLVYFGQAKTNLMKEIRQTLQRSIAGGQTVWLGPDHKPQTTTPKFKDFAHYISAYEIEGGDPEAIHDVEALILRLVVNSTMNAKTEKFKREKV